MQKLTKQIRAYLNMSQTEFAKQLNVTFQTVNRWENGRALPNKDVYKRQQLSAPLYSNALPPLLPRSFQP